MMLVDSHCHLDDERLYGQADEIVASLASDGIGRVIDAGSDLVSSERAVFLAERFHLTGCTFEPVRPHAVEAVGTRKEVDDFVQTSNALGTSNEAALHTYNQSGNAETATADCHNRLVVLRVNAVEVDAFACQTGICLCAFPHIIEVYLFNVV